MFQLILAGVLIGGSFLIPYLIRKFAPNLAIPEKVMAIGRWTARGLALWLIIALNFTTISSNHVGLLTARYGSAPADGRIIALSGERGNRAELLLPGFNIIPLVHVLYDIREYPMVEVPTGYYGRLATRDGRANTTDFTTAPEWTDAEFSKMLDATYFMSNGPDGAPRGTKGLQSSVLKPGRYALNLYLYEVRVGFSSDDDEKEFVGPHSKDWVYDINTPDARREEDTPFKSFMTRIPSGYVGVVRSSISKPGENCQSYRAKTGEYGLVAELVHRGCRGVWGEVLSPGDYYMNRDIYDVVKVPTRVQTWDFKGCYTRRIVNLSVDQDGKITQNERAEKVDKPETAADCAVMVKVEGWDVPQELRVLVQIEPDNAPIVVSAVGGLKEVEDKVLVPVIRSVVRNVMGGEARYPVVDKQGRIEANRFESRPSRVNDLIENRVAIEKTLQDIIQLEGVKTGLDIREVRLGEPALPPEFLVTRLRQQLAEQLKDTIAKETVAQNERIKREQASASANQQAELVKAQIAVQVSEQNRITRTNNGEAEKAYTISVAQGNRERAILEGEAEKRRLELLAEGQKAQVTVLGPEATLKMQMLTQVLNTIASHPSMIEALAKMKLVPDQVVTTGTSTGPLDMSAFGAIFGALSNAPAPKK